MLPGASGERSSGDAGQPVDEPVGCFAQQAMDRRNALSTYYTRNLFFTRRTKVQLFCFLQDRRSQNIFMKLGLKAELLSLQRKNGIEARRKR